MFIAKDDFQRSKGHGFIQFLNSDDGKKAMEQLNNYELSNQSIKISLSEVLSDHHEPSFSNLGINSLENASHNLNSGVNMDLMDTLEEELNDNSLEKNSRPSSNNQANISDNHVSSPFSAHTSECILLTNVFDLIE